MFTSTTQKVATLLMALAVLAGVTGIAQAATSKSAGMSKAEYRALMIRSDGMNEKYRLGRWHNVPQGMTPDEYRALTIRSEALNKQYHLGKWSTSSSTPTAGLSHGFSWEAFGIGAVAMLGLVLLAGGVVAGSRHGSESTRIPTS
jgi:hypothetical protein